MTPEWNQHVKERMIRNQVDRLRNELLNPRIPLETRIEAIKRHVSPGFWRLFGYERMYDYLRGDLQLSPAQAKVLTWEAIQNGYEEPDERVID